jgi:hypothetical protein
MYLPAGFACGSGRFFAADSSGQLERKRCLSDTGCADVFAKNAHCKDQVRFWDKDSGALRGVLHWPRIQSIKKVTARPKPTRRGQSAERSEGTRDSWVDPGCRCRYSSVFV